MTSEDISKIGTEIIETTENAPKVKIPVAEYRNLIEAVSKLRIIADSEHSAYMREWSKANKLEEELDLYKAFVESERDLRERFYEFKQDKAREV
jgi:hypothetical protein